MSDITYIATPDDGQCGIGTYTGMLKENMENKISVEHIEIPLGSFNPIPYVYKALIAPLSTSIVHVQHEYGLYGPKSLWSWLFFVCLYISTRVTRTPVVTTFHSAWTEETVGPPLIPLKRLYVKLNNRMLNAVTDYSLFLSENCEQEFNNSVDVGRARKIEHGVQQRDTPDKEIARDRFGYSMTDTVVAVPGYVRYEKGTDRVPAIAGVRDDWEFLVAGGGQGPDDESELAQEVAEESPDNVTVTGWLDEDDLDRAFAAADAITLPYREVTQSGIFNLAVSHRTPVVGSDVEYFYNLREKYRCVLTGDPERPEHFAAEIQRVIRDDDVRNELLTGMNDYEKAHSADSVVDEHLEVYRDAHADES